MYAAPAFCSAALPRKSRPGPMHAQMLPTAMPAFFAAAFTATGSMCEGSSTGISTVSKPHFLNCENSLVLAVTNGLTNRNELIPKRLGVDWLCVGLLKRDAPFARETKRSQARDTACRRNNKWNHACDLLKARRYPPQVAARSPRHSHLRAVRQNFQKHDATMRNVPLREDPPQLRESAPR